MSPRTLHLGLAAGFTLMAAGGAIEFVAHVLDHRAPGWYVAVNAVGAVGFVWLIWAEVRAARHNHPVR